MKFFIFFYKDIIADYRLTEKNMQTVKPLKCDEFPEHYY